MVKELLGDRLNMAPIGDSPQKILDLGTGCGVWAIEGESLRAFPLILPTSFLTPILYSPYHSYSPHILLYYSTSYHAFITSSKMPRQPLLK